MSGARSASARWARTGAAAPFGPTVDPGESGIGWTWEIRRGKEERRLIRVEVTRLRFVVTDLPAEARNAIRSRGATAVDAYLHQDTPPEHLVVTTEGVHPRNDPASGLLG